MNNVLISMFIDNELDLDDKAAFVERVHGDASFREETLTILHQEKLLRSDVTSSVPDANIREKRDLRVPRWWGLMRPAGLVGSAIAAALVVVLLFVSSPHDAGITVSHRFIIYRPDVTRVELAGSFNEWRPIPLEKIGESGYWEVTMDLPRGEHRFSYILEGDRKYPDPTVITREQDDFGGENSVLMVDV